MNKYSWLVNIYNKILDSYCNGRGHHALLFISMWNNGEKELIYSIIRWLFCINSKETRKWCNSCNNCQLINTNNHPDYYVFDLKDNIQDIDINMVKECVSIIDHHARQGRIKVLYINNIEFLTNQTINVLLKIIEDPPINTYFFLKTTCVARVPLTLSSRCMCWNIIPPKETIGLRWLENEMKGICNDILLIKCALRLCNGAPIEAKNVLTSDIWMHRLELCDAVHSAILDDNFLTILPFLRIYENYRFLIWLITLLTDALKWKKKIKDEFIINLDRKELISLISVRWNQISLINQIQQWIIILRIFQEVTNIDYKLLLIYRLLNWHKDLVESYFYSWS